MQTRDAKQAVRLLQHLLEGHQVLHLCCCVYTFFFLKLELVRKTVTIFLVGTECVRETMPSTKYVDSKQAVSSLCLPSSLYLPEFIYVREYVTLCHSTGMWVPNRLLGCLHHFP